MQQRLKFAAALAAVMSVLVPLSPGRTEDAPGAATDNASPAASPASTPTPAEPSPSVAATPLPAASPAPAATAPAPSPSPSPTIATQSETPPQKDTGAAPSKDRKKTKMTRRQEIEHALKTGTVPSRYRSSVPKQYQKYIPFEK
jgi:hypothetical protein